MNLDGFIKREYAIQCETEEESTKLLETLEKLNYTWCDDSKIIEENMIDTAWETHKEETCYAIVKDNKKQVFRRGIMSFEIYGYKIVKFSELAEKPEDKIIGGECEKIITDDGYIHHIGNIKHIYADKPAEDFKPTKSYLMEHKDEYVLEGYGGLLYADGIAWDWRTEDLQGTTDNEDTITAIYKKVWNRPQAKQMSQAELIKAYEDATGEKVEVVEG